MSNEPGKMSFDPIPVTGATRPELPKIPDLPPIKSTSKPLAPSPETPVEPAAPVPSPAPAAWLPESLTALFKPTRTKGILAAGVVSLVGGAATMNLLWPPKRTDPTASVQPEQPAPLPDAKPSQAQEPNPFVPKVQSVTLPSLTATVPTTTVSPPEIALPDLGTAPSAPSTAVKLPDLGIPSPSVASPGSGNNLQLPDLIKAGGAETVAPAGTPIDIKLPATTTAGSSGGTSTSVPMPAITLPSVTGIALPQTETGKSAQAELSKPETKLEISPTLALPKLDLPKVDAPKAEPGKETKAEGLPLISVPVTGGVPAPAPANKETEPSPGKLPEIGLPKLTEVAVPTKSEPKPELKIESPVPALPDLTSKATTVPELPKVAVVPASASTTSTTSTTSSTAPRTDYDVDLHYVKSGDSWAAISRQHFGDERYAEALKGYNQNAALAQMQRAEIPPIHVLRKNYANLIGRPVEKSGDWTTIATAGNSEPKRAITGNGYKVYVVPSGGRTLKEIAADAFGDEGRWGMVWDTNPKLVPDKTVPEGTRVYLHSMSKIGD